jgi:hypothetical protein
MRFLQQQVRPEQSLRSGTRPPRMRIYLWTRYVHHGWALRPPLLVSETTITMGAEKSTLAMNESHRSTRAAGVSPPWFYESHLEVQCD